MTTTTPGRVLGVGLACLDQLTVWRSIGRPVADNTILRFELQGGGMVATALAAVTRLGAQAEFWGAVGTDRKSVV